MYPHPSVLGPYILRCAKDDALARAGSVASRLHFGWLWLCREVGA